MSFGLRNTGATYQRLADKVFESLIGMNIEVYLDNMVIKIRNDDLFLYDIEETFANLRAVSMKLNPKKCLFEAEEGKFLGHVIMKEGIRVNAEKIESLLQLRSSKTVKEVHALNGKLVALGWFLEKSTEKTLPFYKMLKRVLYKKDF